MQNSKLGRPGMRLALNPRNGFAVGMDIGVDFISVLLTDFAANVLWRQRVESNPDEDQIRILDRATEMTALAIDEGLQQGLRPLGVGIGAPGLVDIHQGKLIFAPNLRWINVPLRLIWSQRFDLPVFVENEANAAALGEYYFGVARGVENLIYLSAGIGLGGGVGAWGSVAESCQATIHATSRTTPDPGAVERYEAAYRLFRELYPALKPAFDRIAGL